MTSDIAALLSGRTLFACTIAMTHVACILKSRSDSSELELSFALQAMLDASGTRAVLDRQSPRSVVPLLDLLGRSLASVRLDKGGLEVVFDTNAVLTLLPHDQYESWQIISDKLLIVCTPGGDVAEFNSP